MKYQKIDSAWLPFVHRVQRRLDEWGWGTGQAPDPDLVDAISRALRLVPKSKSEPIGPSDEADDCKAEMK